MTKEIEIKDILDRLGRKIGQLEIDNEVLTLQLTSAMERLEELEPEDSGKSKVLKEGDNGRD